MAVIAGQIGSNQFTVFELEPAHRSPHIEEIKRAGVDYEAYKQLGLKYPEQELRCQQQFSTHSLAHAASSTYHNYIGTNQALTRGSQSYGTYKFLRPEGSDYPRISPPRFTPVMVGDPGGLTSGWIVEVVFRVRRVS